MMGKGKHGFSQAPLPPPPMPWPGYMQVHPQQAMMMQHMTHMAMPHMPQAPLQPPTAASSASWVPEQTAEQIAREKKLQELMTYLKKRGPDLPQDVTQKVQELSKKDGAQAKKDLQMAAKDLGQAKDELEAALQARVNLVSSWKHFLTDAVKTWQEYAQLFQSQENDHQARIVAAKANFAAARTNVDEAKAVVGEVIEINDKEDDDEFNGPANAATSDKIMESMQFLTTSLEQFRAQAEEIHVEAQSSLKRPRLSGPEITAVPMDEQSGQGGGSGAELGAPATAASLQPFPKAGLA